MEYLLERETEDILLEIHYEYHKAIRGHRNSLGVPEEPDDPEEIEIISITQSGKPFQVTDKELKDIETACWKDLS